MRYLEEMNIVLVHLCCKQVMLRYSQEGIEAKISDFSMAFESGKGDHVMSDRQPSARWAVCFWLF